MTIEGMWKPIETDTWNNTWELINLPACPSGKVKNAVKWFLNIEIWFFENLESDLWESSKS